MMDAPDMIASMREEATHLFEGRASVTTSKPTFLEFNPLNTSKGLALKWCADHLHFRLNETLAFGDSLNDLSMLHAAGRGIAVANARKDVLCEVDDVCLSNEEDGVAHYLLNHVSL